MKLPTARAGGRALAAIALAIGVIANSAHTASGEDYWQGGGADNYGGGDYGVEYGAPEAQQK